MKIIYISHKNGGEPSTFQDPSPDSSTDPEVASHHGPGVGHPPPPTPPGGLARMVALELGEEGYPDSAMVLRGVPPTSARAFRLASSTETLVFFVGGGYQQQLCILNVIESLCKARLSHFVLNVL